MPIIIRSTTEGFRRAGMAHSKQPKEYADDFFTSEQLALLEAEPKISITRVEAPPDEKEEDVARSVLEGMTVDKLKSDCSAMGIEYPGNAKKAELVDLILKNTAPAPEQ